MKRNTSKTVYERLLEKMRAGELLPGMPLPSENALAEEFGVSRPTVRKALESLEGERRIVKRPGIGNFASDPDAAPESRAVKRRLSFAVDSYGTSYYNGLLIRGMNMACEEHGCQLSLSGTSEFPAAGSISCDGMVLMAADPADFARCAELSASTGIPIVMINRFPTQSQLAYFSVDYVQESAKAVEHLISLGHRSIALIGSSDDGVVSGPRSKGWEQAFAKRGLSAPESLRFPDSRFRESVDVMVDFLKDRRPTALFVTIGSHIPQLAHALGRANMRVPEDISIICFDDMEDFSDSLGIPLSYVKMPLQAMGRRAIEHLVRRNEDPSCKPARALFEASLVINSACRPLNPPG